jgi:HNH endonuclease
MRHDIRSSDRGLSLVVQFWNRVNKNGPLPPKHPELGPCWLWTGQTRKGYGALDFRKKKMGAHRVSWEIHNDKIPDGHLIHHKCEVTLCVNPDHIELRTALTHPINSAKTHCIYGHPLTPENTYVYTRPNGRIFRQCKICQKRKGHNRMYRL